MIVYTSAGAGRIVIPAKAGIQSPTSFERLYIPKKLGIPTMPAAAGRLRGNDNIGRACIAWSSIVERESVLRQIEQPMPDEFVQ